MTFCELLAERQNGADRITAWKCVDKYSNVARYEITVSRGGIAYRTEKAARTTWKKKFMEA